MSIAVFDEGFGHEPERDEPSGAELAAMEGVHLCANGRRRLRRYYEDVIRQCWRPSLRPNGFRRRRRRVDKPLGAVVPLRCTRRATRPAEGDAA